MCTSSRARGPRRLYRDLVILRRLARQHRRRWCGNCRSRKGRGSKEQRCSSSSSSSSSSGGGNRRDSEGRDTSSSSSGGGNRRDSEGRDTSSSSSSSSSSREEGRSSFCGESSPPRVSQVCGRREEGDERDSKRQAFHSVPRTAVLARIQHAKEQLHMRHKHRGRASGGQRGHATHSGTLTALLLLGAL